jgi:DNA ligase (NAD+)
MNTDIASLVAVLETAKEAYYGGGDALLTDAEFDSLEDQLRELDPTNSFFAGVGAKPQKSGWVKVKHGAPMGSLEKCQTYDEVLKWYKASGEKLMTGVDSGSLASLNQEFVVSEKLDGISISLKYENGQMVQALTRGDGETGEDITRNVLLMKGVVWKMRDFTGHVRGEIVLKKSDHQKHVPEYKNPRNAASGIAKRESDPKPCEYLTVVCYQVLSNSHNLPNKATEFKLLEALGFETPDWFLVHSGSYKVRGKAETTIQDPLLAIYEDYVKKARADLDYEIDGLVVEFNDAPSMEFLGEHGGRPKGARAFKFPHVQEITTLLNVTWEVGNSGRITPVAHFKPIMIDGADLSRASLHNPANFLRLRLWKGCRILVSRRNQVIPYVERNLDAKG